MFMAQSNLVVLRSDSFMLASLQLLSTCQRQHSQLSQKVLLVACHWHTVLTVIYITILWIVLRQWPHNRQLKTLTETKVIKIKIPTWMTRLVKKINLRSFKCWYSFFLKHLRRSFQLNLFCQLNLLSRVNTLHIHGIIVKKNSWQNHNWCS